MIDRNANPRARVFISCGQNKITDEERIAREIGLRLEKLGYDPYIAIQEQTLRGLRENIFAQLQTSEYFIFVDFKREEIDDTKEYRGSLFSNQELAIASYLDLPALIFQEKGVKARDGILFCLQANIDSPFGDRVHLPNIIADKVQQRGWISNWRNDLLINTVNIYDLTVTNIKKNGRFFIIDVHNRHRDKIAKKCYAYLEKLTKIDTNEQILFRTFEIKWSGYPMPNAHILPGSVRGFDAFWIRDDAPDQLIFAGFRDTNLNMPNIKGRGTYELHYMVVADGFPAARCVAILDLDGRSLPTKLTIR